MESWFASACTWARRSTDGPGEKPEPDGFALETRGPTLFVVGGDARGTLYGVYELLEALGVRWFMPGDLGEDVLEKRTVGLPALQTRQSSGFRSVSGFIWASANSRASQAWELRMKARVGTAVSFGHNWSNILPLTKDNLARYPEAFAEVDGVRGKSSRLCSAHPDVVRLTVEAARDYFARTLRRRCSATGHLEIPFGLLKTMAGVDQYDEHGSSGKAATTLPRTTVHSTGPHHAHLWP